MVIPESELDKKAGEDVASKNLPYSPPRIEMPQPLEDLPGAGDYYLGQPLGTISTHSVDEAKEDIAVEAITFPPGRKLKLLYDRALIRLQWTVDCSNEAIPDRVMRVAAVRDAYVQDALEIEPVAESAYSVWQILEENEWIARLMDLGSLASADDDLTAAAVDFITEAVRLFLCQQYPRLVDNRHQPDR